MGLLREPVRYETFGRRGTEARHRAEPNHIVDLVQQIKKEKAQLLLYGAQNPRVPQQIAAETGIKVLRLYSSAGGRPETDTYIKWIDYTVRTLVQAVS